MTATKTAAHLCAARLMLVLGMSSACGDREVARDVALPRRVVAAASVDGCETAAMKLEVTPPDPGAPRATFSFSWEGEGTGERSKVICVISGHDQQLVPRGEHHEIAIRADAHELQRIIIDGLPHLIFVPPDAAIVLGDNPCFFYELSGPNTDAWFVDKSRAYCARPGAPCKNGYVRAGSPRPIHDELCGPTDKEILRCVAQGSVRLTSAVMVAPEPRNEDHLSLADLAKGVRLSPRHCGFAMVETARETVALAIGSGERWLLTLDGDRLAGHVQ